MYQSTARKVRRDNLTQDARCPVCRSALTATQGIERIAWRCHCNSVPLTWVSLYAPAKRKAVAA